MADEMNAFAMTDKCTPVMADKCTSAMDVMAEDMTTSVMAGDTTTSATADETNASVMKCKPARQRGRMVWPPQREGRRCGHASEDWRYGRVCDGWRSAASAHAGAARRAGDGRVGDGRHQRCPVI
jgi:folate-binding Fe-S cluster repair protein YgfZ